MADVSFDRDEWMRRTGPFYPGLLALWTLSVLPLPRGLEPTDADRVRSAPWFPLVGGLLGGLLYAAAALFLGADLSPALAAVLVVVLAPVITAVRLETGLMATFGGLASGRGDLPAREHSVTAVGVVAAIALFALRAAGLIGTSTGAWLSALVCAHLCARWAVLFLLTIGDGAGGREPDERMLPRGEVSWAAFGVSTAMAAVIVAIAGGGTGVLSLVAAAAVAFAAGPGLKRLGGLSESRFARLSSGAVACACEVAVLLIFAAAHPAGAAL